MTTKICFQNTCCYLCQIIVTLWWHCCETKINCNHLNCDNFKLHGLPAEWKKCLTVEVENRRNNMQSGTHLSALIQVRRHSDLVARLWASSYKRFTRIHTKAIMEIVEQRERKRERGRKKNNKQKKGRNIKVWCTWDTDEWYCSNKQSMTKDNIFFFKALLLFISQKTAENNWLKSIVKNVNLKWWISRHNQCQSISEPFLFLSMCC